MPLSLLSFFFFFFLNICSSGVKVLVISRETYFRRNTFETHNITYTKRIKCQDKSFVLKFETASSGETS